VPIFKRKPPPTAHERFLAEVEEACRTLLGARNIRPSARPGHGFDFDLPGQTGANGVRLDNLWHEVRDVADAERHDRIAAFVRTFNDRGELRGGKRPWEDIRSRLRPTVRPVGWATGHQKVDAPPRRPIAPFVVGVLAIDEDDSMAFASPDDIAAWPVSADDAWQIAVDNLTAAGLPAGATSGVFEDCFTIMGPDSYESSWLCAHAWLAERADRLPSDPLLLVPARSFAMVVPSRNEIAVLAALAWAAEAYRAEARPLSPAPYLLTTHGFVPWHPPADHPAAQASENAHRLLALTEYQDQTTSVQDLLTKAGEDVYVATLEGVRSADGTIHTWTSWPANVTDELVPRADFVGMFGGEDRQFVRWEDAERIASDALVPEPGWDPPRWRARGWPPPDRVAALRAVAVDLPA
jgi:hypothetical protein